MKVFIHSLEKTIFAGEAKVVILPSESGEVSILDNHIPLVTTLKKGVIRIKENDTSNREFTIKSGFAEINSNKVIVLVN